MSALARLAQGFARDTRGAATLEFVLALPIILTLALMGIDTGALMLRQASLDRAVDIAVREVRLGRVTSAGRDGFAGQICARTVMVADCVNAITIEMTPIDRTTWAEISTPARCVNRTQNIRPVLAFNPAMGDQALMMVRVCVATKPFLRLSGDLLGMRPERGGDIYLVARTAFANEP